MKNNINAPNENVIGTSAVTQRNESEAEISDSVERVTSEADDDAVTESSDSGQNPEEEKKNIFKIIKDKITEIGYESIIVRLITAWITISCYNIISGEYIFTSFDFFKEINMALFISLIAVVFIILNVINKKTVDKVILFASSLIYCSYAIVQDNKLYFTIGLCIFMGAAVVYCVGDWITFKLKKLPTIIIIAVLGLIFTLFVGLLTSFLHLRHYSSCYDFGIFSQMFYYMKETFQPLTTCERDRLLSHFAVHFSPIYYLLLPFFYIFPSPVTLLIGQAAIIASGLIPLYLICKNHKLSNNATVLFALCYVLLPSMANGCFYFLHENKFLTALVLWVIYALEKNKWIPTIICTLLLLMVKEDAPVYAAVIGLYFMMSRRRISKGAAVLAFSVLYFVVVSNLMAKYGLGTMSYRYDNFIYDGSGSLITVIKSVILNPIYTIYECFDFPIHESYDMEKITFLLQMLVPVAFMPLMTKKPSRFILFIPFILMNLMSDYRYQHDIGFQYTYGSAAFLFYIMVLNYEDMKPGFRSKVLAVAVCSSILMFMCCTYHRTNGFKDYKADVESGSIEVIDDALDLVPRDSSVAATTFLIPAMFDCREIYEYETTQYRDKVEYIVLDMRFGGEEQVQYENNPIYETVTNIPGKIAIFRNTAVTEN